MLSIKLNYSNIFVRTLRNGFDFPAFITCCVDVVLWDNARENDVIFIVLTRDFHTIRPKNLINRKHLCIHIIF